ncbi:DNA-directed DNA polymerase epsilon, subunit C [Scheffersomyces stipitis CBS 6054]|uniref:DNA-directed DNA polymerase epsilon, subunit C n=1 Tax=Scheffersomyces stipitis (strain ATCC 58785 / CBS 6054 / NBRC 10063 / NRRL Y-11545) TaxID=322104 RepID=A3LRE3_PICST|nr:DNA-directed DNA polymerase epsilon, subunit C [Scheffersomyces stipitis CBS 6054]ABN65370.2 DNA-directed DNA polymerase epsilon, subunit C [Scheffersomyces stipitis CBS 6054]KAG2734115.1 hypothetical protein G9P44_003640 [Scheffersomyces stipitis]
MSSPGPNMNSSQAEISAYEQTPTTTSPPMPSNTATPDVEMEDPGEQVEQNEDHNEPEAENADIDEDKNENAENDIDDNEENDLEIETEDEQLLTLPIAKIKRIFKLDPDYVSASQSAVYATGLATELFIQYFTEQASLLAKMDKRKKIQYRDFSTSVASHDALAFLSDTVPRTQPIGELIQKKQVNLLETEEILSVVNPEASSAAIGNSSAAVPTSTSTDAVVADASNNVNREAPVVKVKSLPKGQQTLDFAVARPFKKAVIHDLMSNDDSSTSQSNSDDVVIL